MVTQTFDATAQEVWEAITERDQMVQWYFEQLPAFEPRPGFETSFRVDSGERSFLHHWKVREAEAPKRISYEWNYPEYQGEGLVDFHVTGTEKGCRLKLSCYGIESFPQHIPEFRPESCRKGWEYFINGRLKSFMEKS